MARINGRVLVKLSLISSFILILLLHPFQMLADSDNLDTSKIGVDVGNEFTYQLETNIVNESSQPFYLGGFGDGDRIISIEQGDEFTITISDTSVKKALFGYALTFTISNSTTTSNLTQTLDTSSFVTFIDWDYWETKFREEAANDTFWGPDYLEIQRTDERFQIIFDYELGVGLGNETLILRNYQETHYDLNSGVLLYYLSIEDVFSNVRGRTLENELSYSRVGYNEYEYPTLPRRANELNARSPVAGVGLGFLTIGLPLVMVGVVSRRILNRYQNREFITCQY